MVVCVFVYACVHVGTPVCVCAHVILVPFLNNRKSSKTW